MAKGKNGMIWAISDLHGCYEHYMKALERINFSEKDTLYVIGDIVDRGKHSMKILQHMMEHPNIIPIAGNHEYMMLTVLKKIHQEITDEFLDSLTTDDLINYQNWMENGGNETLKEFRSLSKEEKADILDYLQEFSLMEEVAVNGNDYILVHAGFEPFDVHKHIYDYSVSDLLFKSPDIDTTYFDDIYVISGHSPTLSYGKEYKGKIISKNNHILIDCGCVFGFGLGIFCLDTQEKYYI